MYYGLKKSAILPGYIVRRGDYAIYIEEAAPAEAIKYAQDKLEEAHAEDENGA